MLLLTAVNLILRKLGEVEVPSLDEQYPTIPLALAAIDEAKTNVLTEGWWFNTLFDWTATPDPNGFVELPASTLIFYPEDPKYIFEGQVIVKADNHDPYIGEDVKGKLVLNKDFERLPNSAAMAVSYLAAFETYVADIGPDATSQAISASATGFMMALGSEHTRSRKKNTKHKKAFSQWRRSLIT